MLLSYCNNIWRCMCKKKNPSLWEIMSFFSSELNCIEYWVKNRWGGIPVCPHCEKQDEHYFLKSRSKFKCKSCKRQFSVTTGTKLHSTKISLSKWMTAMYMLCHHKKGISSYQLAEDIQVTQKTAWFMLSRLRESMDESKWDFKKLSGQVEVDETYVGGKQANKHKNKRVKGTQGRSTKAKVAIVGMIERNGKIRARSVANVNSEVLLPLLKSNIADASTVFTDEFRGYAKVRYAFNHLKVDHSAGKYVIDEAHTNTIENFWSLLKRSIIGIYHRVSPKHIDKYVAEASFRYNNREKNAYEKFEVLFNNVNGRLTYEELTAAA